MLTLDELGLEDSEGAIAVRVVCTGGSMTGRNRSTAGRGWIAQTYPIYLERYLLKPDTVANMGIADATSDLAAQHVCEAMELFPHARYHVIAFGMNDLENCTDYRHTSADIISNLDKAITDFADNGIHALLVNVPGMPRFSTPELSPNICTEHIDDHNRQLQAFCKSRALTVVDIADGMKDSHFVNGMILSTKGAMHVAGKVATALRGSPDFWAQWERERS